LAHLHIGFAQAQGYTVVSGKLDSVMRPLLTAMAGLLLSACASMTSGTLQRIDIATEPEGAATCTLTNEKGNWELAQAPGAAMVSRAHGELTVACTTPEGSTGTVALPSGVAAAAFGNILLVGSVVWAAVDVASGAAFAYPDSVTVVMVAPGAMSAFPASPFAPIVIAAAAPRPYAETTPEDARRRLKLLQAQRESNHISEAEYQLRVKPIVNTVGSPRPPTATR
jgi:hypothetical protein